MILLQATSVSCNVGCRGAVHGCFIKYFSLNPLTVPCLFHRTTRYISWGSWEITSESESKRFGQKERCFIPEDIQMISLWTRLNAGLDCLFNICLDLQHSTIDLIQREVIWKTSSLPVLAEFHAFKLATCQT
jgi:hypothetical protein